MANSAYAKLTKIQNRMNVPKNRFNKFGGYAFRSAEDIMEAAKPLLIEHGCALFVTHEIVMIGDRHYNMATATFVDCDTGDCVQATDYAREDGSRKGMTGDQLSGCASSYAAKYALKGLFILDDSDDSDATNGADNAKHEKNDSADKAKAVARLKNAVTAYSRLDGAPLTADEMLSEIREEVSRDKSKNTAEFYNMRAMEFEEAVRSA